MYHASSENSQHRTGDKFWSASCKVKPPVSWKWRCGCECDLTEQEAIGYQPRLLQHSVAILADLLLKLEGFSHC